MGSKTDDQLIAELNVDHLWVVRAGAAVMPAPSLQAALLAAHKQSAHGESITHISRMPEEDLIIEAPQIARLWNRLGLLGD